MVNLRCAGLQAPMLRRRTARARLQLALEERQAGATMVSGPSAASMLTACLAESRFCQYVQKHNNSQKLPGVCP